MNAIEKRCRPKHQVLVLKCYPRTSKGAVDVKPNSSELSYLLFYATSRRSKIQKIGAFLEKKTASDVWRLRIGNVQVTLGILAALLEKTSKDVGLIAPCVFKILDLILRSNDITMIESSLPMFGAFCEHREVSSLFADQTYLSQYESVVRSYAQLASTRHLPGKGNPSRPVQMRWRSAGLEAIRKIAASEALSSVTGRQIHVILPMILENIWSDADFLDMLLQRVQAEERVDTEKQLRRRTSVGTVATINTVDTSGDTNPLAISGTAGEVDQMAEENIGVLAMQCLKSIFVVPNRTQIYSATGALLKFILERVKQGEGVLMRSESRNTRDGGWATTLYSCIARWAPVQDRYTIVVVALDTLTRMPIQEQNLEQHIVLTAMTGSLLRSDTNLIGLSVIDVLLRLIKHMKRLLQLPRSGSSGDKSTTDEKDAVDLDHDMPSKQRELLDRLEQCVSDLATHVYYADQISDMISAIIVRLRPARSSSSSSSPHGEKLDTNEAAGLSTIDLTESQSQLDVYFGHNQGRVSALRVIRFILLVANPRTKVTGNFNLSRNRVPIQVWEGTQWLLRDLDGRVRKAYTEALTTWLDRETTTLDTRAHDDTIPQGHPPLRGSREISITATAQRATSNTSNRERPTRRRRAQFLPLLHLAIYDNALQYVDFDNDLVILHILLTKLVFKLGVNAVKFGLPMIYRLQEDVQELEAPVHKVRVAAVCHGYFWALSEKFDFESSSVGRVIQNEIVRRRSKSFWVEGIHVPPPAVDTMGLPGQARLQPDWDLTALEKEELLPFDDRTSLVECIATGYEEHTISPPGSPAASPGRVPANPILGSTLSSAPTVDVHPELPSSFRDQLQVEWSRDAVIAVLAAASRSESLNGSRAGTGATAKNRLTISTAGLNGNGYMQLSPHGSNQNLRPRSAQLHADQNGLGGITKLRKSSLRSAVSPTSTGAGRGIASIEQLKMVLSGNVAPQTIGLPVVDDDSGDSMISYDYTPSELSFNPQSQSEHGGPGPGSDAPKRSFSAASHAGPLSSHPPTQDGSIAKDGDEKAGENGDVPPVPPLPSLGSLGTRSSAQAGDTATQDFAAKHSRRKPASRGEESFRSHSVRSRESSGRVMDLQELLMGIDSRSGEGSLGNVTKPPY